MENKRKNLITNEFKVVEKFFLKNPKIGKK